MSGSAMKKAMVDFLCIVRRRLERERRALASSVGAVSAASTMAASFLQDR
jgi:hypothetical protein